jgi:hypothetical protein
MRFLTAHQHATMIGQATARFEMTRQFGLRGIGRVTHNFG